MERSIQSMIRINAAASKWRIGSHQWDQLMERYRAWLVFGSQGLAEERERQRRPKQVQLSDRQWLQFIDDQQPEPSELVEAGETSCLFSD